MGCGTFKCYALSALAIITVGLMVFGFATQFIDFGNDISNTVAPIGSVVGGLVTGGVVIKMGAKGGHAGWTSAMTVILLLMATAVLFSVYSSQIFGSDFHAGTMNAFIAMGLVIGGSIFVTGAIVNAQIGEARKQQQQREEAKKQLARELENAFYKDELFPGNEKKFQFPESLKKDFKGAEVAAIHEKAMKRAQLIKSSEKWKKAQAQKAVSENVTRQDEVQDTIELQPMTKKDIDTRPRNLTFDLDARDYSQKNKATLPQNDLYDGKEVTVLRTALDRGTRDWGYLVQENDKTKSAAKFWVKRGVLTPVGGARPETVQPTIELEQTETIEKPRAETERRRRLFLNILSKM